MLRDDVLKHVFGVVGKGTEDAGADSMAAALSGMERQCW